MHTRRQAWGDRHLSVAREAAAAYGSGAAGSAHVAEPTPVDEAASVDGSVAVDRSASADQAATGAAAAAARLLEAAQLLGDTDLDALGDEQLREVLRPVQRTMDRLVALRMRLQGALETRALRRAGPGREGQALRITRDRTADELRLTPSEVKRAGETGRRLEAHPAAADAAASGDLPTEHARLLTDTLRWLDGDDRARAEATLLEAARTEDARRFGRTCRRLLAEIDASAAETAQQRRTMRRSLRVSETPDGMTAVNGQFAGLGGEFVHTALHAFRRPDAAGERRTPEQRSADAFVDVCRAALDAGRAPTRHGVRPHILVTVAEPTVRDPRGDGAGVCELAWTGPLPWTEARRLLADASVSRVLLDPDEAPTRAGEAVRTVPAGLWKTLQVRHRTCAGDGCTVPVAWCQAMHLETPYRLEGRLDVDESAPGCDFHHRMFDRHGWTCTWVDGAPVVHHPARPPRRARMTTPTTRGDPPEPTLLGLGGARPADPQDDARGPAP